jgi:hypothetical protein
LIGELFHGGPEGRPRSGQPMGTPSHDLDEAPPSLDQETNTVVSGGGLVGADDAPGAKARPS